MKLLSAFAIVPVLACQTPSQVKQEAGSCSVNIVGSNNHVYTCPGLGKEQGQKMLGILNKILANQIDADAVMAKLDEILKAVNPNQPQKTYFCNGQWRIVGPSATAALNINMGGDDTVFQEMIRLANSGQNSALLKVCEAQIQSSPEWLTSRLFCGLAHLGLGDKAKARESLTQFESRTGPSYEIGACLQMTEILRKALQ